MQKTNITNPDISHLRILSICFYFLATMSACTVCLLFGFVAFGVAIMLGAFDAGPPEVRMFFGLVLTIFELALALLVLIMCSLEALTGRSLATRKRYRLCFVMACIELLNFPVGTILGIFTIIVLQRPGVRDLFLSDGQRDPRLDALDDFGKKEESETTRPNAPDDGAIREGAG